MAGSNSIPDLSGEEQRGLRFKNDTGETIPPFGVIVLDGATDGVFSATKTTENNQVGNIAINGEQAVSDGGFGFATMDFPTRIKFSGDDPADGNELGVVSGSFALSAAEGKFGFKSLGDIKDDSVLCFFFSQRRFFSPFVVPRGTVHSESVDLNTNDGLIGALALAAAEHVTFLKLDQPLDVSLRKINFIIPTIDVNIKEGQTRLFVTAQAVAEDFDPTTVTWATKPTTFFGIATKIADMTGAKDGSRMILRPAAYTPGIVSPGTLVYGLAVNVTVNSDGTPSGDGAYGTVETPTDRTGAFLDDPTL